MIPTPWLLLINSMTGESSSFRVRLWRQLKALGAAALRDGAYLLPERPHASAAIGALRDEILAAGGTAYALQIPEQEPRLQQEWQALFDRSTEYRDWMATLTEFVAALPEREAEARRSLRQRRKDLDAIAAIDFFAGEMLEQAQRQLQDADRRLTRYYSPDEPIAMEGDIPHRRRADYQGKTWATRARPWVDRVASAWLIQRFIDSDASFLWLTDITTCPGDALGFDFDGATFTHVGDCVSFEVLLSSFDLNNDPALARLAALVHALDVDGEATAEGAGFEAILAGARARIPNDDALLLEMSAALDSLYTYFQADKTKI